jgi:lipoprotein-anchoring transpeptidase ErfK/SrfK
MFVRVLSIVAIVFAAMFVGPQGAEARIHHYLFGTYDDGVPAKIKKPVYKKHVAVKKHSVKKIKKAKRHSRKKLAAVAQPAPAAQTYQGAELVKFASAEKPGTLIIKTDERALYRIMKGGQAMRFLVAVGKEGFAWSGVARVGMKRVNPPWTPPVEMIQRKPDLAKWASGMPGGDPENPLGPRAMYLYKGKADTGFRIHGTIHPESIGTAASSGCIRMLNQEVIRLFEETPVGTKVIVI